MSETTQRWAEEMKADFKTVRQMRDEVKVRLHLGNMEMKQRFEALEARLDNEQLNARKSLRELISEFTAVKSHLSKRN